MVRPACPRPKVLTGQNRFVEFDTAADLKTAVEKLDGREFKGARVTCTADVRRPRLTCLVLSTLLRDV